MKRWAAALLAAAALSSARAAPPALPTRDSVLSGMKRGVEFLLADQNPDSSWGGARGAIYTFTGDVWSNPETHRTWRVATTGLCCMALMHAAPADDKAAQAATRGLDYLLANAEVKRPSDWDTMNCWAYIYAIQAYADATRHEWFKTDQPRKDAIREQMPALLRRLASAQSLSGGWGYLEFDPPITAQPQWATSFTTAAGVVALLDAREAGFAIDDGMLGRAIRAVERCKMRSGAYAYSVEAIPDPRHSEWIDQIKGSLGRIQACNLALLRGGREMPTERLRTGLRQLFEHHRFLDIARNRPIPHETYYYNAGYFYLFGHYYAARVIDALPAEERDEYRARLWREILKTQQQDGALYDYDMHAYHKPYGTAFRLLGLAETLKP